MTKSVSYASIIILSIYKIGSHVGFEFDKWVTWVLYSNAGLTRFRQVVWQV